VLAGPAKNEITINSSYFNVEITSKPDYQNQYGNGFDQALLKIVKSIALLTELTINICPFQRVIPI
jgi:hypothetical protein